MDITLMQMLTDPIFRAPLIGSFLICMAMGVVGVILFIRGRLLIGEALSHAAYPGVVLSAVVASLLFSFPGEDEGIVVLIGAFVSALAGLFFVDFLERKARIASDAALCFMLSLFFGVGVLCASRIQFTHAVWYKQVQSFLYGQAATLDDRHLIPLALLSLFVLLVVSLCYRLIQWAGFDREYVKVRGGKVALLDALLNFLLILSLSIGIRCVGVVLMAGMLIAPATAARFWTKRLSSFFALSGIFGLVAGGMGNILSLKIPVWIHASHAALPTGPTILVTASLIAFFSMVIAPQRGLFSRFYRFALFRFQIEKENLLKAVWKGGENKGHSFHHLTSHIQAPFWHRLHLFFHLRSQGWIEKRGKGEYALSADGARRASHIVRLHRLWEVYLVEYLGQQKEKAHHNAEEMEHILTPELERQLTQLLNDPKLDPHEQPIPKL